MARRKTSFISFPAKNLICWRLLCFCCSDAEQVEPAFPSYSKVSERRDELEQISLALLRRRKASLDEIPADVREGRELDSFVFLQVQLLLLLNRPL